MPKQTTMQRLLNQRRISQAELARRLNRGVATVSRLVAQGEWPKSGALQMRDHLRSCLLGLGAQPREVARAIRSLDAKASPPKTNRKAPIKAPCGSSTPPTVLSKTTEGEDPMLIAKQTLTQEARQAFSLPRDPFIEDVQESADVFLSKPIRYVRETMWAAVKHGGLLAITGESGAGKSTLRRDVIDRIQRDRAQIIPIMPHCVIGMEESDIKGRAVKAAHLTEAVIHAINPRESLKRSLEARYRQMKELLTESYRAGKRHVLIIEEAHRMPRATLKHLKGFYEQEDGFKKLLGIILIGQPELRDKLNERDPEVREITQRCDFVELPPLNNELTEYLDFKLKRVGIKLADVMDAAAIEQLRERLTLGAPRAGAAGKRVSMLYPLAIANVLTAAMNLAAETGQERVTADLIKEI